MHFRDICSEQNLAWEEPLCNAYHYTSETGTAKTVFRYQIPFPPEKEALLLTRYGIPLTERMSFYQTLVRCVERQVSVSKKLTESGLSSILSYSRVEQERGPDKTVSIYLETEQVWPVMDRILGSEVPYMTLLEVISRLSLTLRDISKPNINIVHRGLDLGSAYINSNKRILLAGFFYAACNALGSYPAYLPVKPPHLSEALQRGEPGSSRDDIQALAKMAWNLFSGLPYDAAWATIRMAVPEFTQGDLSSVLWEVISKKSDDVCNSFRKKLSDHRKQVMKDNLPQIMIPVRKSLLKEITVTWVPSTSSEVKENTNTDNGGK